MKKYKFILKWSILGPVVYAMYNAAISHQWDLVLFAAVIILGVEWFYIKYSE